MVFHILVLLISLLCVNGLEFYPLYSSFTLADPDVKVQGLGATYSIKYHPADFGPFFVNHSTPSVYTSRVQIVEHQCGNYSTAFDGTSYAGTFILYKYNSLCSFPIGISSAIRAGAAGLIVYGCDPADTTIQCLPGRAPLWLFNSNMQVTIPVVMISNEDAKPIINAMAANNATVISMTFPATGPLVASEFQFLLDLKQQLVIQPADNMDSTQLIMTWNGQDDPCVNPNSRFTFIWCEAGHITGIVFVHRPFFGVIPPSISTLTELKYLMVFGDCCVSRAFPDLSSNTKLKALTSTHGNPAYGPCSFYFPYVGMTQPFQTVNNLPNNLNLFPDLEVLAYHDNNITSLTSGLNTLTKLKAVLLSNNQITTLSTVTSPDLIIFDVSSNKISTPLPSFSGFAKLVILNMADNQYTSTNAANSFDNLLSLQSINLKKNLLSGPVPNFVNCPLTSINLARNQFTGIIPNSWNNPTLSLIDISNNQITGPWDFTSTVLNEFVASNNQINPYLWNTNNNWAENLMFTLPTKQIELIDFSYNKITGKWDNSYFSGKSFGRIYFSFNDIQSLPKDMSVNNFRVLDVSYNNITGNLKTLGPISTKIEKMSFQGNPLMRGQLAEIAWIRQDQRTFTKVGNDTFNCYKLVGNGDYFLELEVDASYYNYDGCICDRGYYQQAPACKNIDTSRPIVSSSDALESFTDSTYGNQRLMKGINTNWVMRTNASRGLTKQYNIILNLIPSMFNEEDDYIEIFEGDASLTGKRVFSVRGNDPNLYQNSNMKITVLDSVATLVFKSQKTYGKHFDASFSVKFDCPDSYKFDPFTNKCQYMFQHSLGLQGAVWAVSAVYTLILVIVTAVVVNKRNSLIIRSASFPFCFVMLICMIIQCAGSIFYAMSPELGEFVCQCRPWFTALPLVGTLSALLVKADRIRKIFGSKELVVQAITNVQLAKAMGVMLAGELILLLAFSGGNLTYAQIKLGTGTVAEKLVYTCNTDANNYNVWIAIQFAYIALFLFAGVVEAWGVRNVPSAFNEGPHIASCLMSLVVLLVILIPVNYLVDDNPNALIMIRGLGQVLVTAVMSFFLFGPKLYYIVEGKENDKTLSSIGSSKSSNSSSSSSASEA